MSIVIVLLESALLASSCSVDAFAASFAYGAKGVKIPLASNYIINFTCSFLLGASLVAGGVLRRYLPGWLTTGAAFAILFVIGLIKLLDSATRALIRRYSKYGGVLSKEMRFTLFNLNFILSLYANPEEADVDNNNVISTSEAVLLAVSLSLDGIAAGFGAALGGFNAAAVVFASLITNVFAVSSGCRLGRRLSGKLPFNVTWLSGLILIGLAFSKLL